MILMIFLLTFSWFLRFANDVNLQGSLRTEGHRKIDTNDGDQRLRWSFVFALKIQIKPKKELFN